VEKYRGAGQATDDNMAHALCVLDTEGYNRTIMICTATVVARTCQNVMLCYVIRTVPGWFRFRNFSLGWPLQFLD